MEDVEKLEQEFRDAYGEDPAGAVFSEIMSLHQRVGQLEQSVNRLRNIIKEIDPERMDRLEMKETMKAIEQELSETE